MHFLKKRNAWAPHPSAVYLTVSVYSQLAHLAKVIGGNKNLHTHGPSRTRITDLNPGDILLREVKHMRRTSRMSLMPAA